MSNKKIVKEIEKQYLASLKISRRKSRNPVIVAMVGLIGSGKSSVTRALAPLIGATVIEADKVRVALRKKQQGYESVRSIVERAALLAVKRGGNVIIDSDFVDIHKRQTLQKKARQIKTKVIYLRTYADRDVVIGRIVNAKYTAEDLFGGASTAWKGENKGTTVALREIWRRTPWHYRWSEGGGGRFLLKKLRIPFLAEIDTGGNWRKQILAIARKIKAL